MTSSNRHPFVLLGAAASLITVLGFLGVNGLATDVPVAQPGTPAHTTARSPTTPPSVTCTVVDELGEGQAAESVQLTIGGRTYRMSIGTGRTRQQLRLRLARPAQLTYTVTATTTLTDGTLRRGTGQGSITCSGGETYALAADHTTDPAQLLLERS